MGSVGVSLDDCCGSILICVSFASSASSSIFLCLVARALWRDCRRESEVPWRDRQMMNSPPSAIATMNDAARASNTRCKKMSTVVEETRKQTPYPLVSPVQLVRCPPGGEPYSKNAQQSIENSRDLPSFAFLLFCELFRPRWRLVCAKITLRRSLDACKEGDHHI